MVGDGGGGGGCIAGGGLRPHDELVYLAETSEQALLLVLIPQRRQGQQVRLPSNIKDC